MTITVKPSKEPGRIYKALEIAFFAFYRDGVLHESRAKRRIGVLLGLLLHLMEEIPAGLRLLKLGYRQRKKSAPDNHKGGMGRGKRGKRGKEVNVANRKKNVVHS